MRMEFEVIDLVDYGDGLPYTRIALSILNKISKKPGITVNKIIDEFDDAERDDIYPSLGQNIIWTLVGELAVLDYVKLEDGKEGKVTITDKGKKKLEDFKKSWTTEEKTALKM
jgi:predicted transcriptional regulator